MSDVGNAWGTKIMEKLMKNQYFCIFLGRLFCRPRCAQHAPNMRQDGAAAPRRRSRERIWRGYISRQVAKTFEDGEFEIRRWMDGWMDWARTKTARHLARRSAERRRIEEGCALVPPHQFTRTSGGSWTLLAGFAGRSWGIPRSDGAPVERGHGVG